MSVYVRVHVGPVSVSHRMGRVSTQPGPLAEVIGWTLIVTIGLAGFAVYVVSLLVVAALHCDHPVPWVLAAHRRWWGWITRVRDTKSVR